MIEGRKQPKDFAPWKWNKQDSVSKNKNWLIQKDPNPREARLMIFLVQGILFPFLSERCNM